MNKKCPKCGFEYGEFDIFCSRCGFKFSDEENKQQITSDEFEALKQNALDTAKEFFDEKNKAQSKREFSNFNTNKLYDSAMVNFAVCLVIIAFFLTIILFVGFQKHNAKKQFLKYKSYINNPSRIPQLKEPVSTKEFTDSLGSVEEFLLLYLKYTKDNTEKKQQVFNSYLKEIEKAPHLTNESLIKDENDNCFKISTLKTGRYCTQRFNNEFKNLGVKSYLSNDTVYVYPDYAFINKTFSKYLTKEMGEYLTLKAKYNTPSNINLELMIEPKILADKIYDSEKMLINVSDLYIEESLEKSLYNDFRTFIFSPLIYATTTQEMRKDFKNAYKYYISSKTKSSLSPVVMSYLDKQKAYNEENFKNDYPYKVFDDSFDDNIKNSSFSDVFSKLRQSFFSDATKVNFAYIYNTVGAVWNKYEKNPTLTKGQFVFSEPDENNSISIFDSSLSIVQELNISNFSKLFILNNGLYIYNSDKLSISKIQFNGKMFVIQPLNFSDVSSVFPGVEIINIDSYSNYNINLEKENKKANYIILSKYSRGFEKYKLTALKGQITPMLLPNMFGVVSDEDVIVSFHGDNVNPDEISEALPSYKLTIRTLGYEREESVSDETFATYDEHTAYEERQNRHEPNIMPKINNGHKEENDEEILINPPQQNIEPPVED